MNNLHLPLTLCTLYVCLYYVLFSGLVPACTDQTNCMLPGCPQVSLSGFFESPAVALGSLHVTRIFKQHCAHV